MHLPFAVKSEVKSKAIYLECFCWFQNSSALFQGFFEWELRSVLFAQQYGLVKVPSPKHEGF